MNKILKQITLLVDEEFENKWLLEKARPSEISEVLKIGCSGYLTTRDVVVEEHLKKAEKNKYQVIEEKYKNEIEEMKTNYEEEREKILKKHKHEIDIYYGGLLEENERLKKLMNDREDKLRKEYDEKEKEVRQDLLKLKDIYSFSENSKKGELGEKNISIRLQKLYPNCEVEDLHKTDDSGDIWIKFPEDNCVILVESKLKKDIKTNDDLEKFKKDIILNTHNVDCGLFVSLLPASIPNLGDMHISIIDHKFVGYITDVFNEPAKLPLMIKVLRYLNKSSINNNLSNNDDLLKYINKFIDKTSSYTNMINNLKKNNDSMMNLVNNNSNMIVEFNTKLQDDIREIDDYLQDNNVRIITEHSYNGATSDIEYTRQKIRHYMKQNNKRPTMKDISKITGFTTFKIAKLGGVNHLVKLSS